VRTSRGTGLVELLVGMALALVVLSALTAAFAAGGRLLVACGARGEAEDTAQLAVEAFTFDARRAGYDPAAAGIASITEASADHVTFTADLDGDGVVDANSEETTTHLCVPTGARLSRVIGQQSMPLADRVTSCGFRYLDAEGAPITVLAGGLDAAGRSRVRAVALDLVLLPMGLAGPAERGLLVALRSGA
jgi:Tfp pilus assembly protein PilW